MLLYMSLENAPTGQDIVNAMARTDDGIDWRALRGALGRPLDRNGAWREARATNVEQLSPQVRSFLGLEQDIARTQTETALADLREGLPDIIPPALPLRRMQTPRTTEPVAGEAHLPVEPVEPVPVQAPAELVPVAGGGVTVPQSVLNRMNDSRWEGPRSTEVLEESVLHWQDVPFRQRFALARALAPEIESLRPHLQRENDIAVVVDGDGQQAYVIQVINGQPVPVYQTIVSTGRNGFSDQGGSKGTPRGLLRIGLTVSGSAGQVIRYQDQQPQHHMPRENDGKAYMTTSALYLHGQEQGNRNSQMRGIAMHGTNREQRLGTPDSGGCVRFSNRDVILLTSLIEERAAAGQDHVYVEITDRAIDRTQLQDA